MPRVVELAGGVGGAKLADGLQAHIGAELTVVVNTGDDCWRHGLLVMPDHDTVLYNLAGIEQVEWGWGIEGDTRVVMDQLGVYGEDGSLASIGVIGAFPMARRRALLDELAPYVTTFDGHPWDWAAHEQYAEATPAQRRAWGSRWNAGKDLSFVPLRPELVVETKYDYLEGGRLRHTGQFVRWRPDRDPESCTYAQLEQIVRFNLADVLTS
jgi:hypothetical protein